MLDLSWPKPPNNVSAQVHVRFNHSERDYLPVSSTVQSDADRSHTHVQSHVYNHLYRKCMIISYDQFHTTDQMDGFTHFAYYGCEYVFNTFWCPTPIRYVRHHVWLDHGWLYIPTRFMKGVRLFPCISQVHLHAFTRISQLFSNPLGVSYSLSLQFLEAIARDRTMIRTARVRM